MWSDRPEDLEVWSALEALAVLCPHPGPAQLLHIILSVGPQLSVPSFPRLSGLIAGENLKGLRALIPHFF